MRNRGKVVSCAAALCIALGGLTACSQSEQAADQSGSAEQESLAETNEGETSGTSYFDEGVFSEFTSRVYLNDSIEEYYGSWAATLRTYNSSKPVTSFCENYPYMMVFDYMPFDDPFGDDDIESADPSEVLELAKEYILASNSSSLTNVTTCDDMTVTFSENVTVNGVDMAYSEGTLHTDTYDIDAGEYRNVYVNFAAYTLVDSEVMVWFLVMDNSEDQSVSMSDLKTIADYVADSYERTSYNPIM